MSDEEIKLNDAPGVSGAISKTSLVVVRHAMLFAAAIFAIALTIALVAIPSTPDGKNWVYTSSDYESRQVVEMPKDPDAKEFAPKDTGGGIDWSELDRDDGYYQGSE